MSDVLGRPIVYRPASVLGFARLTQRRGHPLGFVAVMVGIYLTARLGLAATVTPDLPALLGREPTGLRRFVEDHRRAWAG